MAEAESAARLTPSVARDGLRDVRLSLDIAFSISPPLRSPLQDLQELMILGDWACDSLYGSPCQTI